MLEMRMVMMLETSVELVIGKLLDCSAEDDIRDRTQRFLMRWAVYLQNLNNCGLHSKRQTLSIGGSERRWNIILICSDPVRRPVLCLRVLVPFTMKDSSKFLLFLVLLVLCAACALRICWCAELNIKFCHSAIQFAWPPAAPDFRAMCHDT